MPKADLDYRKKIFAKEYIKDFHAGGAHTRAGYKSKTKAARDAAASRLLKDPDVIEYIKEEIEQRKTRLVLDQDSVLLEQSRVAFSDMTNYLEWDEFGVQRIRASEDLTEDESRAIETIEYQEEDTPHGTKKKMKIKLYNKNAALDSVMKHLGLYAKDNKQKDGGQGLSRLLEKIREAQDEVEL